jgi:hypothetical protein
MRKLFLSTVASMCLAGAPALAQQHQGCSVMSITKLHPDHPLSKQGLSHISVVRQLDVGLRPGDVVFHFPHGKMVVTRDSNGMLRMPMRDGIIPEGVNNGLVFQEAKMLEFREREMARRGKGCGQ